MLHSTLDLEQRPPVTVVHEFSPSFPRLPDNHLVCVIQIFPQRRVKMTFHVVTRIRVIFLYKQECIINRVPNGMLTNIKIKIINLHQIISRRQYLVQTRRTDSLVTPVNQLTPLKADQHRLFTLPFRILPFRLVIQLPQLIVNSFLLELQPFLKKKQFLIHGPIVQRILPQRGHGQTEHG